MAKKEKSPQAEGDKDSDDKSGGEKPDGEGAVVKTGLMAKLKSKKMLMILAPALVVVLGGGGTGAYFLLKKPKTEVAKAEEVPLTPPKVAFTDMADITVNIQAADGAPAYLKLGVSLEVDNDEQKTALTPLLPRINDQFQAYLRELRLDDLKGSAGVLRLKEELLRRVNVAAAPYKVRDVLLKEMIVQ